MSTSPRSYLTRMKKPKLEIGRETRSGIERRNVSLIIIGVHIGFKKVLEPLRGCRNQAMRPAGSGSGTPTADVRGSGAPGSTLTIGRGV